MFALFNRFDFRLSIGYCILAALWILLSDTAMNLLFSRSPPLLATVSVFKGWLFVAVTGLALFAILRIELRKRDQIERFLQNEINTGKRTLEALQSSEKRFAAIFHGGPIATSISRAADGYIIDCNDALLEVFSYDREELIGHTSVELGLSANLERNPEASKVVAETGGIRNFELQGRAKSGKIIYLLASIRLIDLEDEPHFVSMFYDITEQRKLEGQLRYQALLLQNVSDGVFSTDVDFIIRSWNPAAELIFGWRAEEVIGQSARELFKTEYQHSSREYVLSQLQTTGVWRGETTNRCKDGSRIYLSATISYIYDKSGHHIGIVSVNRDITELMKAQQEKQEAAQLRLELEHQTELVRLKEDFISVVSHEFRTPLTVIMSSSELLATHYGQMPAERQLKHFQVILDQTKYMSALIDDVLTINRARAGKLEFNPVPLDLMAFCREVLQHLEEVDRGKHSIVFTSAGDLSSVTADVKLLQHILVNLLSNAIKYSPTGGEVRLAVERQGDEMVFQVGDQGIGIPAESLPHLYEPFYRAKNTGDIGGTGLGTAIVKDSVDFYKGTISYESEVGVGTTVTVKLPAI